MYKLYENRTLLKSLTTTLFYVSSPRVLYGAKRPKITRTEGQLYIQRAKMSSSNLLMSFNTLV